ncbi:hypothetical protein D3C76_1767940 [compost metagenome]
MLLVLIALTLVEGAKCGQNHLVDGRQQRRIHRDFLTIERDRWLAGFGFRQLW